MIYLHSNDEFSSILRYNLKKPEYQRQWMNFFIILLGLLPIIIYSVVHRLSTLKAAVLSAASIAVFESFYIFYLLGHVGSATLLMLAVIVVSSYLTLRFDNSDFFRYQPAFVRLAFVVMAILFEVFNEPFIVAALPELKLTMPDYFEIFENPDFIRQMIFSTRLLFLMMTVNVVFIVYSVKKRWSDFGWLMMCMSIYPLSALAAVLAAVLH